MLAARDQVGWDLGLMDVGGGQGRPDARRGAMECAGLRVEVFFVNDVERKVFVVL